MPITLANTDKSFAVRKGKFTGKQLTIVALELGIGEIRIHEPEVNPKGGKFWERCLNKPMKPYDIYMKQRFGKEYRDNWYDLNKIRYSHEPNDPSIQHIQKQVKKFEDATLKWRQTRKKIRFQYTYLTPTSKLVKELKKYGITWEQIRLKGIKSEFETIKRSADFDGVRYCIRSQRLLREKGRRRKSWELDVTLCPGNWRDNSWQTRNKMHSFLGGLNCFICYSPKHRAKRYYIFAQRATFGDQAENEGFASFKDACRMVHAYYRMFGPKGD